MLNGSTIYLCLRSKAEFMKGVTRSAYAHYGPLPKYNSTSSSVRVTTELHEKHAQAYLVVAVLAIRSVNTCVSCTKQNLGFLLQQRSLPGPVNILTAHPQNELVGLAAREYIFKRFLPVLWLTMFSRQIQYRIMVSEGADVVPSSAGPPDHDPNIESTLRQLNTNMGTMTTSN